MANSLAIVTVLSPSLKNALAKIENAQPGEPLSISSQMIAEARDAMAAVDAALQPAPIDLVKRWLEALGALVAAAPGEAEAARKIHAMATMLEFPASAFNRASLNAAARKFRFFPSYAELCEHLEAETAGTKTLRHQLRRLVALPVSERQAGTRWSELTPEQRAEFDRLMAGFRGTRTDSDGNPLEGPQDA